MFRSTKRVIKQFGLEPEQDDSDYCGCGRVASHYHDRIPCCGGYGCCPNKGLY